MDAETTEVQVSSIRHEHVLCRESKPLAQNKSGLESGDWADITILRRDERCAKAEIVVSKTGVCTEIGHCVGVVTSLHFESVGRSDGREAIVGSTEAKSDEVKTCTSSTFSVSSAKAKAPSERIASEYASDGGIVGGVNSCTDGELSVCCACKSKSSQTEDGKSINLHHNSIVGNSCAKQYPLTFKSARKHRLLNLVAEDQIHHHHRNHDDHNPCKQGTPVTRVLLILSEVRHSDR